MEECPHQELMQDPTQEQRGGNLKCYHLQVALYVSVHSRHSGPVSSHVTLHIFPTSSVLWRFPKLSEVEASFTNAVLRSDVVLLLGEVYKASGT